MYKKTLTAVAGFLFCFTTAYAVNGALNFESYEWTLINEEAQWTPRAGLQVVNLRNHST